MGGLGVWSPCDGREDIFYSVISGLMDRNSYFYEVMIPTITNLPKVSWPSPGGVSKGLQYILVDDGATAKVLVVMAIITFLIKSFARQYDDRDFLRSFVYHLAECYL
jgi:hypothetical protein